MRCIIKSSFSEHICQGWSQTGQPAIGSQQASLSFHYFTSDANLLPGFHSQKLSVDTRTWIYLLYTENYLAEVSVKTEHKGV